MSILDEIFAHKRLEVAAAKKEKSASELKADIKNISTPPTFSAALKGNIVLPPKESFTPILIP